MIALYYAPPGCSLASHIALEESGLPYTPVRIDPYDEAQRATLVKLNPRGTVPTLEAEGQILVENVAILTYIARTAPEANLMPADPMGSAQCISLLAWCASSVHIAFRQSFRPGRSSEDESAHEGIARLGRETYWKYLQEIDARLADQPWMMGDTFSVADTYPMVFYNWGTVAGFELASLRNLAAFKDRMVQRPAVRTVLKREGFDHLLG